MSVDKDIMQVCGNGTKDVIKFGKIIPLTHKYMTDHFPGLVLAVVIVIVILYSYVIEYNVIVSIYSKKESQFTDMLSTR